MKRRYIQPVLDVLTFEEESLLVGLSYTGNSLGSGNGGSGNDLVEAPGLGDDDAGAAAKTSWGCWDDDDI